MLYRLKNSFDTLFAIILTILLAIYVFKFDILATVDGDIHLVWSYFWNQQILEGQIYPKWFEAAFDGFGTASFIFYPPFARVLSLPFAVLNFSPTLQLKAGIIVSLVINTYGVVKLSRILFQPVLVFNLLAIILGIFNPFLLMEIFKRGGFPSFYFMNLMPLLMVSIIKYLNTPVFSNFVLLTLAYSIIFLTHLPSCVIFFSAYVLSLIILFITSNNKIKIFILKLGVSLAIGILIDAFFFAPILFDIHLVHQAFSFEIGIIEKFLFFSDIFQFKPEMITPTVAQIFWFHFILFLIVLLNSDLFSIVKHTNKNFLLKLQTIMVAVSLLMNTILAYPIYAHIDFFGKLQFPWRYFVITSTLIPYLITYSYRNVANKFILFKKPITAFAVVIIIAAINYKSANFILREAGDESYFIDQAMTNQDIEIVSILPKTIKLEKMQDYYYIAIPKKGAELFFLDQKLNFFPGDVKDYVPKTASISSKWSIFKHPNRSKYIKLPQYASNVEFVKGKGSFDIKKWNNGIRILDVQITEKAIINLKTFYYPGWKIKTNPNLKQQKLLMSSAEDGRIELKLPRGNYHIEIYYKGTKAEQAGFLISLITITVLFIAFLKFR